MGSRWWDSWAHVSAARMPVRIWVTLRAKVFRDGKAQSPLNTKGRLKTGRQNTNPCKEQADPQPSFSLVGYGRWLGRNCTREALNSGHLTQSRGGAGGGAEHRGIKTQSVIDRGESSPLPLLSSHKREDCLAYNTHTEVRKSIPEWRTTKIETGQKRKKGKEEKENYGFTQSTRSKSN